jgi:lipoprotein signal peptidase
MIAIFLTLLGVLVSDQALKQKFRRIMGRDVTSLGPFGQLRITEGRLWLVRLRNDLSRSMMWSSWMAAAAALVIASSWIPSSAVFVGLLLGGSLSNAADSFRRGSVTDYVCLRFWPAFNLADLALAAGAIGTLAELAIAVRETAS